MKESISLELTREDAEVLARIFALINIQLAVNPDKYHIEKSFVLAKLLQALDYQIHEVAHWCDKSDCSYYVKRKSKVDIESKSN